ncbi:MAG: hypothetical protein DRH89_03610, partial [Candidatus Cloacimonadota bacterium]
MTEIPTPTLTLAELYESQNQLIDALVIYQRLYSKNPTEDLELKINELKDKVFDIEANKYDPIIDTIFSGDEIKKFGILPHQQYKAYVDSQKHADNQETYPEEMLEKIHASDEETDLSKDESIEDVLPIAESVDEPELLEQDTSDQPSEHQLDEFEAEVIDESAANIEEEKDIKELDEIEEKGIEKLVTEINEDALEKSVPEIKAEAAAAEEEEEEEDVVLVDDLEGISDEQFAKIVKELEETQPDTSGNEEEVLEEPAVEPEEEVIEEPAAISDKELTPTVKFDLKEDDDIFAPAAETDFEEEREPTLDDFLIQKTEPSEEKQVKESIAEDTPAEKDVQHDNERVDDLLSKFDDSEELPDFKELLDIPKPESQGDSISISQEDDISQESGIDIEGALSVIKEELGIDDKKPEYEDSISSESVISIDEEIDKPKKKSFWKKLFGSRKKEKSAKEVEAILDEPEEENEYENENLGVNYRFDENKMDDFFKTSFNELNNIEKT